MRVDSVGVATKFQFACVTDWNVKSAAGKSATFAIPSLREAVQGSKIGITDCDEGLP
jgi:hypothetical protein